MKPNVVQSSPKRTNSNYKTLVEKIYSEQNTPTRYRGSIDSMLREFFSKTSKTRYTWKRDVFRSLLIHLYDERCYALLRNYNAVEVLHNICSFGNRLVRPVEAWKSSASEPRGQLRSLIRHCFAEYETPRFMEASFFGVQKNYMLWYVQLGTGRSVKELSQMPLQLTSKMAHTFRNAPANLSVPQALRYAQAIGFGASQATARTIAISRLSMIREDQEVFWATVVQFLAKEEKLLLGEVDTVLDYLGYKYREDASFSMKHRSLNALTQQSREWHQAVFLKEKGSVLRWTSAGIAPLYVEEVIADQKVVYRTVELLDSAALYEEGLAMQHCVAEYDESCYDGHATIFSLQKEVVGEGVERLATLEIRLPEYELVQAKAKLNADPNRKSQELLQQWMKQTQVKPSYDLSEDIPFRGQVREYRAQRNGITMDIGWIVRIVLWVGYLLMRACVD